MKVYFFGDSICFGQGISLHKGWIPRLSLSLEEFAVKNGFPLLVTNSAVNGRTSRRALEDMPFEIQSHRPDVLVVQFGMNDCNYWMTDRGLPRVSPEAFSANLKEIVVRAFRFETKTIVLNTNHPTTLTAEAMANTDLTYQQSNQQYNEIIRDVVRQFDERVVLNDVENYIFEKSGGNVQQYLLEDRLHLNEKGHDVYFEIIDPVIKSILSGLYPVK